MKVIFVKNGMFAGFSYFEGQSADLNDRDAKRAIDLGAAIPAAKETAKGRTGTKRSN